MIKNVRVARRVLATVIGLTIALQASGCVYDSSTTNLSINGDDTYSISSLDVLSINNDEHICKEKVYRTDNSLDIGYHLEIDGTIKFGIKPVIKDYYSYIDIKTNNEVAKDENMQGYDKSTLASYFTDEDFENAHKNGNGYISYEYAMKIISQKNKVKTIVPMHTN